MTVNFKKAKSTLCKIKHKFLKGGKSISKTIYKGLSPF